MRSANGVGLHKCKEIKKRGNEITPVLEPSLILHKISVNQFEIQSGLLY